MEYGTAIEKNRKAHSEFADTLSRLHQRKQDIQDIIGKKKRTVISSDFLNYLKMLRYLQKK